jgi:hypothetical protein
MSIPIEASDDDQIVKLTPSHVGSRVSVITFSSTVLNMEQTVALEGR